MMSLHKLTAGDGYTYLTRQVAAADSTERGYNTLGDYYNAKGESPGRWFGRGLGGLTIAGHAVAGEVTEQQMRNLFGEGIHPDAQIVAGALRAVGTGAAAADAATRLGSRFPTFEVNSEWADALADGYRRFALDAGLDPAAPLSDEAKQTVRTTVADQLFAAKHGRLPATGSERSGFIAQQSRPDRSAVAGYDLTFSPVKSISTLWAVAPKPISERIEAAHQAAVTKTLQWVEKEAGYTRVGARSVGQVETRGLISATFTHRDSRAGDPDLHTHAAISNKVQTKDGRWLALDARMLYRIAVGASEFYNTEIEAQLTDRLGVHFAERSATTGKRPVREVVGVAPELNEQWSKRRAAIDSMRAGLADRFLAQHGRVPTTVEMVKLSAQATLATRQAKHEPRSLGEQRRAWRAEAIQTLGNEANLDAMVRKVTNQTRPQPADVTPALVTELAQRVVTAVSDGRATWRQSNLDAEARRVVRGTEVHPQALQDLAAQVADVAAGSEHSVPIGCDLEVTVPVPAELARSDGATIFRMAKGQLFTSDRILAAEQRVLAAAGRGQARTITADDIELAKLEWSANNGGAQLNPSQAVMLREVATSDRQVVLALAPAGTGKTTVMGVLASAWHGTGGTVLGLAPQASAAQELGAAIPGAAADTIDKLVHEVATVPASEWSPWVQQIDEKSLVVIDEAGLASTPKLDAAIAFITGRGGRVLLIGDDQQRAANGAGGILRDIEAAHGALTLTEVMRFTEPVEGQASIALRAGDPSVVGLYADRDRIKAVTPDTVSDHVFRAWADDVAGDTDSIMIAPTIQMVTELNARARASRLAAVGGPVGAELTLPNGERLAAGDVIITKRNQRQLSLGARGNDFVRNNHRWTVDEVRPDGSIVATEMTRNVTRALPRWYIQAGHVRLGYAHTHASVQGITVGKAGRRRGTAHAVVTPGMTRNDLYPTLTRATDGTTTYVVVGGQGDAHDVTKPDAISPVTPQEILAEIIATDGRARSVTTEQREAADPFRRLGHAADAYAHSVLIGAQTVIGPELTAQLATDAQAAVPGVTDAAAWDVLHAHLVVSAANNGDPIADLAAAAGGRELATARDIAAVLDYRMDPDGNHGQGAGPLPWLPASPASVTGRQTWGQYIHARSHLVTSLAQQVAAAAREWDATTAPSWALPYLSDRDLVADLAVWRAAESIPDADLRPAGPTPRRIAMIRRHSDLVSRSVRSGGAAGDHADRWAAELAAADITITSDDYWPVLAARLSVADSAGADVPALLRAAASHPLPAEGAAGALWWRLAPHIGSTTDFEAQDHRLRPPWSSELDAALGGELAQRVTADRLWPVLVGHVDTASRSGADPAQIVRAAADMVVASRATVADHDLPAVLLANVMDLSGPEPVDPLVDQLPLDSSDRDLQAPQDVDTVRPETAKAIDSRRADQGAADPVEHLEEEPDEDPFDVDAHPVPLDLLDLPIPPEPEPDLEPDPSPGVDTGPVVDSQRIADVLTAAQGFFFANAARSWVPRQLQDRGLHLVDAGYAPGRRTTVEHLRGLGFTDPEILAAGLARTDNSGQLYDFFRNRLTLPYIDTSGQVVGFMTRKPAGDSNPANPKYLNSPDTAMFAKTSTLYGLDPAAAQALRAGADIVIVEGPMDAEAINSVARRRGLVAVATGGTALTADHLRALERVAPPADREVVIVMDNDPAGDAAAARAYQLLTAAGVTRPTTVVPLAAKDPAQLLADTGPQALRRSLNDRRPLEDLAVDHALNQHPRAAEQPEYRIQALEAVSGLVARMPAEQQSRQILRVAERTGASLVTALEVLDKYHPRTEPYRYDPANGLDLPPRPHLVSNRSLDAGEGSKPAADRAPVLTAEGSTFPALSQAAATEQVSAPTPAATPVGHAPLLLPELVVSERAPSETARTRAQAAADRAKERYLQIDAAVQAGQGPAMLELRAVDQGHRDRVAAIKRVHATAAAARRARDAVAAAAAQIADAETELASLGRSGASRRRAELKAELAELRGQREQHEAALQAAIENEQASLQAAGPADTHDAVRRAAVQHRNHLPQLTEQARSADFAAVERSRARAQQFRDASTELGTQASELTAQLERDANSDSALDAPTRNHESGLAAAPRDHQYRPPQPGGTEQAAPDETER